MPDIRKCFPETLQKKMQLTLHWGSLGDKYDVFFIIVGLLPPNEFQIYKSRKGEIFEILTIFLYYTAHQRGLNLLILR